MSLKIQSVFDETFVTYGRVKDGVDYSEMLKVLEETTPAPENGVIYIASDENLEKTSVMKFFEYNCYGGMPLQIGYCNGTSTLLNCLEYHRDSEINIAADDAILLVAKLQDAAKGTLDTSKVEAFLLPKGTAVELYTTTMHYAPCSAKLGKHFRVAIVLPKGTNVGMPEITPRNDEDKRLFARNKWILAHPSTNEAKQGAYVGLTGENIDIAELIK